MRSYITHFDTELFFTSRGRKPHKYEFLRKMNYISKWYNSVYELYNSENSSTQVTKTWYNSPSHVSNNLYIIWGLSEILEHFLSKNYVIFLVKYLPHAVSGRSVIGIRSLPNFAEFPKWISEPTRQTINKIDTIANAQFS